MRYEVRVETVVNRDNYFNGEGEQVNSYSDTHIMTANNPFSAVKNMVETMYSHPELNKEDCIFGLNAENEVQVLFPVDVEDNYATTPLSEENPDGFVANLFIYVNELVSVDMK